MSRDELAYLSLVEVRRLIRDRALSSVEVTEEILGRIDAIGPGLNAYAAVTAERALEDARRADEALRRGSSLGSLHGVPVSLKDNIAVAGIRTTAGSRVLADWVPDASAAVALRVAAAGAVLVGKTNLYEFAYGGPSLLLGPVRNPWDETRLPGASSSGSGAALAAGLCFGSVGTDSGGSIRIPAAFCGVVGLKPTLDRVPMDGIVPVSHTLDHAGPLARSVGDAAVLLAALTPEISLDDLEGGVAGMRIGFVAPRDLEPLDVALVDALEDARAVFASVGARLEEVDLPELREAHALKWTISNAEAAAYHRPTLERAPELYGPSVRKLLEEGARISRVEYTAALGRRRELIAKVSAALAGLDALVLPTVPAPPFPVDQERVSVGGQEEDSLLAMTRYTSLFNLTGQPAVSVPSRLDQDGLPLGLQVVGPDSADGRVLRVARAYERAAGREPPRPRLSSGRTSAGSRPDPA